MATKHIVDAHALIWYLEGNPKLGNAAKNVLDHSASELVLPVIALAEAMFIVDKGKASIPDSATLLNRVQNDPRFEIYPLTFEILQVSLSASAVPEMHDRLIVATGLHLQSAGAHVAVLTKDIKIIASGLLAVVWS